MKDKFYYNDGTTSSGYYDTSKQLHRVDGPAIESKDYKAWYVDGKLHRIDSPAVEYANGTKSWYIDGEEYSEEEFNELMEEAKQLPKVLKLIDPREWVRNYER